MITNKQIQDAVLEVFPGATTEKSFNIDARPYIIIGKFATIEFYPANPLERTEDGGMGVFIYYGREARLLKRVLNDEDFIEFLSSSKKVIMEETKAFLRACGEEVGLKQEVKDD